MCIYKTIYIVYTYQYTWKVTVKDFFFSKIAGLQLTTFLQNVLFQFFRNLFVKKFFEWLLLMAMTKELTILKTRECRLSNFLNTM